MMNAFRRTRPPRVSRSLTGVAFLALALPFAIAACQAEDQDATADGDTATLQAAPNPRPNVITIAFEIDSTTTPHDSTVVVDPESGCGNPGQRVDWKWGGDGDVDSWKITLTDGTPFVNDPTVINSRPNPEARSGGTLRQDDLDEAYPYDVQVTVNGKAYGEDPDIVIREPDDPTTLARACEWGED